jgi:hypothetical protein
VKPALTPSQLRLLEQVAGASVTVFDGRKRRPLEALERLGYVELDAELVPPGPRSVQATERLLATVTVGGRDRLRAERGAA